MIDNHALRHRKNINHHPYYANGTADCRRALSEREPGKNDGE